MPTYPAIALIEFGSIAVGMHAGDAMLKRAPLAMVKAGTVHRGKYIVLVGGSTGAVRESYDEGLRAGGEDVIDSVMLPEVHPAVCEAVMGNRVTEPHDALGVIETSSVAAVVHAADAGIKAAEVIVPEVRLADGLGGKGLTLFAGLVADVQAAVSAGLAVVQPRGVDVRHVVIPALDEAMKQQLAADTRFNPLKALKMPGE